MKSRIFMVLVSVLILLPSLALAQGGWITLPAHAFIAAWTGYEYEFEVSSGGESYLFVLGSGSRRFTAPVVFPQEADGLSVRQMNATVGDFDDSTNISVQLYRMNRYSGISQRVYNVGTGTSNMPGKTVFTDTTGSHRLIDSKKYAWFIYIYFSGVPTPYTNLKLYSVRIQYQ